jgi:transposase InsO family protein
MHQFNKFKNTRGFIANYSYILRIRNMDEEAKRRVRIVNHFNHYGLESTKDAFGVSKASIYRWRKIIEKNPRNLKALNKVSTAPKNRRKRIIGPKLQEDIVLLRTKYPRIGHVPMYYLLKDKHVITKTTMGRIVQDLKKQHKLPMRGQKPYKHKKIVYKQRRVEKVGYEMDTVVRHINGLKWYFVTSINIQTRQVQVLLSKNHTSNPSAMLLRKLDNPLCVQTDNGSEFMKDFHFECEKRNIQHYFTYPCTPKMNAFIERFNRTLEEEFIMWNRRYMQNVSSFNKLNEKLQEYVTYYNTIRPHSSLGYLSPVAYTRKYEKVSEVVG